MTERESKAEAEKMRRALKVIYTWAGVPGALVPEKVRELCGKALGMNEKTTAGWALEFFRRQDEESAAWVKAGKCPNCHGDGVIGGQFCGGVYETCDACNGSGKPSAAHPKADSGSEE